MKYLARRAAAFASPHPIAYRFAASGLFGFFAFAAWASVGLMLLTLGATVALAQSATAVDVGGIYGGFRPYIVDIVGSLITLGVGWLLVLLKSKFNLDIDASHRDALQTALTNGAGLALNKLGNSLQGKSIEVGNPAVASAVNLVLKSAPDALAHFGITPESVAQKIVAKLPQVANTVTPPAGNA
jgi:hypothetical protein